MTKSKIIKPKLRFVKPKLIRGKPKTELDLMVEDVLNSANQRRRKVSVEFLPSGSTMINLAVSNNIHGAIPRARITNIVGDGSSGKSLLALEIAFQYLKSIKSIKSKIFPQVKKAKVVYNNGEGVMDFPVELMYGKKFNQTVIWRRSKNVEAAGRDYLTEAHSLKKGDSLLYIMDSWDSFRSVEAVDVCKEDSSGYNLEKQKYSWKFFAQCCDFIDQNKADATLIVISQTRQKIGVTFGKKKYRTGGDALNFYTHLVPWLREIKKIEKKRFGEKRVVSILSEMKIERTKVGLPFRSAIFQILFDHGIDDISSIAHYLKSHKIKKWKNIELSDIHNFAVEVENQNLQEELRVKAGKIWAKVETAFKIELAQRKGKSL